MSFYILTKNYLKNKETIPQINVLMCVTESFCCTEEIGTYFDHISILKKENIILKKNLTKEVKELYTKNYKTTRKETEENTDKWKDIPCLWIRIINIVKMIILPRTIYRFIAICVKIPIAFSTDLF